MELVKSAGKRTSLVSEVLYVGFNFVLAAGVFLLVWLFPALPILAYLLILLSKWRVFAVRPRFWWANIKANLLDFLLGLSVVTMVWQAHETIWLQIVIAFLYGLWLILIKPRSGQMAILTQAGIAQFMAITALYSVSYDWPAWLVVVGMWLIGYISAQHVLSSYEDSDVTLLSLVWGLIVAELGWLAYSWTFAYSIPYIGTAFQIPQIAIIITLLGYFASRAYSVYSVKNKLRLGDVTFPALFSSSMILILVILAMFRGISS